MTWQHDTMMNPPIEELLDRADSKFRLVTLGSKRARQINSYFGQLGDTSGQLVPPQVASLARKPPRQRLAVMSPVAEVPQDLFPLISLRCALAAGLSMTGPALPCTRELRRTFGLRGREPQVALLAAGGLSNAEIARRLGLSAHTVRHYLERVLDRLGLHSRKALALHFLLGPGAAPWA